MQQLEQALVTLRGPSEIAITEGKMRTYLESHRVFAKITNPSAGIDYQKQITMAEYKHQQHNMRYLKVLSNQYW